MRAESSPKESSCLPRLHMDHPGDLGDIRREKADVRGGGTEDGGRPGAPELSS